MSTFTNVKIRWWLPGVIALVALLAIPVVQGVATAQQSAAQSAAHAEARSLRAQGWEVRPTFQTGFLRSGQRHIMETTLSAGYTYQFVAGGSPDAYDVDIFIYDENFNEVARDRTVSRVVRGSVTPRWTGTFYVVVEMYRAHSTRGGHWYLQTAFRQR